MIVPVPMAEWGERLLTIPGLAAPMCPSREVFVSSTARNKTTTTQTKAPAKAPAKKATTKASSSSASAKPPVKNAAAKAPSARPSSTTKKLSLIHI